MNARLMLLVSLMVPFAAPARSGPPLPASTDVLAVVERALEQADVPALAKLYQTSHDPATRALAAMALERIHFNLDKASEDARICERSLLDSQPRIAFFCARFANGNLRIDKGSRAADAAEVAIAQRFAGHAPSPVLDELRQYAAAHEDWPSMDMQRPSTAFSIPLVTPASTRLGAIEVESHGEKARLLVDTGSGIITLDAGTARRLGVRMLQVTGSANGLLARHVPAQFGVLDRLSFAGVTIRNAPVHVLPGRHRLIGIDILRRLGAFRLGRQRIEVYGSDDRPACRQPMLIASDVWGHDVRVVAALPVNDVLRTVLIDSGVSFYLSGSQAVVDQLDSGRNSRIALHGIGSRIHHTRINQAVATIVVSGQPVEVTFPVFKDASLPWDYVLGNGALRDMDFYFDFDHHHTCLLLHDDLD